MKNSKFAWRRTGGFSIVCINLILWGMTNSSYGDKVGWHDQMSLQPGDGVDLKDQLHTKSHLAIMASSPVTNANTGEASERVNFTQHAYDMVSSLSINTCASLESFTFSGNVGVSFVDKQTFDENTLKFIFTATRDFGDTLYPATGFTSDFTSVVTNLQRTLQGQALHSAITGIYGTHYVHGYHSAASVSVVYSFHFASTSLAQQLSVSAGGSAWDSVSFSTFVNSFFSSTDTSTSMDYAFYTTDPYQSPTNFNFSTAGAINNYQDFTNFVTKVEAYWWSMSPARAKVTGYILDSIQTLPAYLPILGGYAPGQMFSSDYNTFLKTYSQLQSWNERLTSWTLDARRMNWLNSTGKQMARAKRQDVANYVDSLNHIATNHFLSGADLTVPNEVFNYLVTLQDIPIPAIYVLLAGSVLCNCAPYQPRCNEVVGWVDCGSQSLTETIPFVNVSWYYKGLDAGTTVQLYYSPSGFYEYMTNLVAANSCNVDLQKFVDAAFSSPSWPLLSNVAATVERIGFFWQGPNTSEAPYTSYVVRDAEGNVVDEISALSTRSGNVPSVAAHTTVAVGMSTEPIVDTNAVGIARRVPIVLTNSGPASAHGLTVFLNLDRNYDFSGASGTQGVGSFDAVTRTVSYDVGPLPSGASASVTLDLVPLSVGRSTPAPMAQLLLGDCLTNLYPGTNAVMLSSVLSVAPKINIARAPGGLQLEWQADTSRLWPEWSTGVSTSATWADLTNMPLDVGRRHFLTVPGTREESVFRLHVR